MKTFSIIGAGVVGTAVGSLLVSRGYVIKAVVSRDMEKARKAAALIGGGEPGTDVVRGAAGAGIVFITTPDKAIRKTCERIAEGGGFARGALAVHMSGALSSEELGKAREAGALAISLHPLQSLASVEQAMKNLPGSYFSIEGDAAALDAGRDIVEALGGLLVVIPKGEKALYHAGAAVASNYLVAVVDFAAEIFASLGMEKGEALRAIMPLVKGTVNNLDRVGLPDALTGPIARGDVGTVEGHVRALEKKMPGLLPLYRELGIRTVKVGAEKGTLGAAEAGRLMELL
ncbi:MAG TPA: DUF2520 domain-containing protein, partial [Nitrospirota bacterium]|nr:DUF2520 domain-containing protein [Nitrospirota bacterium]